MSSKVRNRNAKQDETVRYRDRLTKDDLLEIYRRMWFARIFDDTLYDMKKKGRLRRGNVYGSRGQEAIQVGTSYPLRPDDYVSPIHRDMPVFVFRGMSVESVMAQVWGKANAPTRGKDSWSHMGDMDLGIVHSTSMLGSTIPVMCGVLWAQRLDGHRDRVGVTYTGEGATATGPFHEGLNYAAVHKLPLIVVVENNQYAYSTPVELEVPTATVAERAKGYGIPGYCIDGNDVLEVYDTMCAALDHARSGKGPVLIECVTYRLQGHADHDETRARQYRPVDEIEMWEKRDPIPRFREHLLSTGLFEEAELPQPPADIVRQIMDAVEFAINSPDPEPHTALEDIYDESAGVSR
ncbi:MAG: thiamine pyrophosphate-dependent dehydrogenase E1 component subunit alpha [Fimbriimonadales bacterium]